MKEDTEEHKKSLVLKLNLTGSDVFPKMLVGSLSYGCILSLGVCSSFGENGRTVRWAG